MKDHGRGRRADDKETPAAAVGEGSGPSAVQIAARDVEGDCFCSPSGRR